ncbi:MAG: hypothetical protein IKV28_00770 [Bacteroidales bacterium]|nr:hypothetical protein [Bacteroidales bacterium]
MINLNQIDKKKILLTLCAVLLTASLQAQEHMTFKGVSMERNVKSFVSQLKSKGLSIEYQQEEGTILTGEFAGRSECTIVVIPTKGNKKVWKVVALFPQKTSWYSLEQEYYTLKESYSEKYGNPESFEFFIEPYEEGDGNEMAAIAEDKCKYASFYTTPEGTIVLEICADQCVQVTYEDAINKAIHAKEKEASVSEDI